MTIFLRSSVKREASDWNRLKADLYISESIVGPSPFNEYWQLEAIVADPFSQRSCLEVLNFLVSRRLNLLVPDCYLTPLLIIIF